MGSAGSPESEYVPSLVKFKMVNTKSKPRNILSKTFTLELVKYGVVFNQHSADMCAKCHRGFPDSTTPVWSLGFHLRHNGIVIAQLCDTCAGELK